MPDFLLKSEEIAALLLLSSSMGLGGASNTCRKETRGLTLSRKNLVLFAFQGTKGERGSFRCNLEHQSSCFDSPLVVLLSLCLEGPDTYV